MLRASDKRTRLGLNLPMPALLHRQSVADWYKRYLLSLTPVAYWQMNDTSGLPEDGSGNNRDMTAVNGSPTYLQIGPMNDRSIDYPSTAYHECAVVSTKTNDFMYIMWLRRDGASTTGGDIFTNATTSGGITLEYSNTTGTMRGNAPGIGTLGSLGVLTNQTWTMLGIGKSTGAGGVIWGLVNGVLTQIGTASPGTPTGNNRIVASTANGQRVAHLAYFDRMLTALEVATLYQIALGTVIPT